jgi:hypothetical protein
MGDVNNVATIKKRRRASVYRLDTNGNQDAYDEALDELSVDGLVPKYSYWEYFSLRYLSYLLRPAGLASIIVLTVALTSALVIYINKLKEAVLR